MLCSGSSEPDSTVSEMFVKKRSSAKNGGFSKIVRLVVILIAHTPDDDIKKNATTNPLSKAIVLSIVWSFCHFVKGICQAFIELDIVIRKRLDNSRTMRKGDHGPEKAGADGSILSLANLFSNICSRSKIRFHTHFIPKLMIRRDPPCD